MSKKDKVKESPETDTGPKASGGDNDTLQPGEDSIAGDMPQAETGVGDSENDAVERADGADNDDASAPADNADDTPADDGQDSIDAAAEDTAPADDDVAILSGSEGADATDRDSDTGGTSAAPASIPTSDASGAVMTPVVQEKIVERKGGFVPTVLGGVVAAGIGFAAAQFMGPGAWPFGAKDTAAEDFRASTTATLDQQAETLTQLSGRVDDLSATVDGIDLVGVQGGVDALVSRMDGAEGGLSGLGATLSELDNRLTTLEKRPVAEAVSPEAIAAYERELEELRAAIETQREEVQTMAAQAVAAEQAAEGQAQLAAARAALAQISAALESGEAFSDPLAQLGATGEVAPSAALSSAAADGVPTLAELSASFPAGARTALTEARRAGAGDAEEGNAFANFMRTQLGARSVTPRDGTDPDAVLSRAEAAVLQGALQDAVNEISTLPEPAQAALADWTAQAQARLDALAAADALMQELNKE